MSSERGGRGSGAGAVSPLYARLPHGPHRLDHGQVVHHQRARIHGAMIEAVAANGYAATGACRFGQKLYVIAPQPTAECLARHWFDVLAPAVRDRSEGHAELIQVRVEETPNCWATFGPGFLS